MEKEEAKDQANEPFSEYGRYTYADYLTWQIDEMVELIKGRIFRNAAAPRRIHQEISKKICLKLFSFLEHHPCTAYAAPFDVRLPFKSSKNEDIDTVVQPDICVVCDKSKLDEMGCIGAPDLIIEILSPGSNKKELKHKYEVYEESGVKEYWIIFPNEPLLLIYKLLNGQYRSFQPLIPGDFAEPDCLPGFQLDLEYVFGNLE
jgi:Uma2 family endonuclease